MGSLTVKKTAKPHESKPHETSGGEGAAHPRDIPGNLKPQGTTKSKRAFRRADNRQKKYRQITDTERTEHQDTVRKVVKFDPKGKSGLHLKNASADAPATVSESPVRKQMFAAMWGAFAGMVRGLGLFFGFVDFQRAAVEASLGETTKVERPDGARAAVKTDVTPAVDQTALRYADYLLTSYSFETGRHEAYRWGGNHMRARLESLAASPFSDLPIVHAAKKTIEALEKLHQDPMDAAAAADVAWWLRTYDGEGRLETGLDTAAMKAEADWKSVGGEFAELRVRVEEPLMTEVPVYWGEGSIMSPDLVSLRESGEILGVDARMVNSIDVAAARLDGRTQIPVGEVTVWVKEGGDIEAVQDAVMRNLPEGQSVVIAESQFGFLMSTSAKIVISIPGSNDLRLTVNVETAPSMLFDINQAN